jgi:hypothetical protein
MSETAKQRTDKQIMSKTAKQLIEKQLNRVARNTTEATTKGGFFTTVGGNSRW